MVLPNVVYTHSLFVGCDGLNENGERLGGVLLLEKVCDWEPDLTFQKTTVIPSVFLCQQAPYINYI